MQYPRCAVTPSIPERIEIDYDSRDPELFTAIRDQDGVD
jgi:hypothetical protein